MFSVCTVQQQYICVVAVRRLKQEETHLGPVMNLLGASLIMRHSCARWRWLTVLFLRKYSGFPHHHQQLHRTGDYTVKNLGSHHRYLL